MWIYDPGAVRIAGSCREEFAVYDRVDDYTEQTTSARKREMVVACDRTAALRSRLVFTTSTAMYARRPIRVPAELSAVRVNA
jgi:hypothetical protein